MWIMPIGGGGFVAIAILAMIGLVFCERVWVRVLCALCLGARVGLDVWLVFVEGYPTHYLAIPLLIGGFGLFALGVRRMVKRW